MKFTSKQNLLISDLPLYIIVPFEPIMGWKNQWMRDVLLVLSKDQVSISNCLAMPVLAKYFNKEGLHDLINYNGVFKAALGFACYVLPNYYIFPVDHSNQIFTNRKATFYKFTSQHRRCSLAILASLPSSASIASIASLHCSASIASLPSLASIASIPSQQV